MNVERAIEHILEIQAQAETRMDRAEARMDRAEARMDRSEARMDRTDRQIAGIQKLIRTGMKLIVRIERAQERTEAKLSELAEAQRKSDLKFDKLVDLLRERPPNGKR